jgi:hypothetical protein
MRGRRWMMAGVVAGSVGLGAVLGAAVLSPGVSFAADDGGEDAATIVCADVLEARGFRPWRRGPVGRVAPWGRPGLWGFADGPLAAAATAIGIEPGELLRALRDGQTIAEVAEANGVDVAAVIGAVVAALTERLDTAVERGWITRVRADERIADREEVVEAIVNGEVRPLPLPFPPPL